MDEEKKLKDMTKKEIAEVVVECYMALKEKAEENSRKEEENAS